MNRITLISAVLLGLLLNKTSAAQEFPAVPNFIRDLSKAGLLGRETVQRELELTDEQTQAVGKIARAESAMRTDLKGLIKTVWPEERPAKAAEVDKRLAAYSKEVEKKAQDVLTANQLARLDEIYVQTRGVEGLFDPLIASKLGLSDDQKAKLAEGRRKYTEALDSWAKLRGPARNPQESNVRYEERRAIKKKFEDAALASLTTEQLDQFKKLRGKLIDLNSETVSSRGRGRGLGKRAGSP